MGTTKAKRRSRAKCIHFDEKTLCCKHWRESYVVRNGKTKMVSMSRECTMRGDCGYEEKEGANNG